MDTIHKAGKQIDSPASGGVIPFVVSSGALDLMGDQIVQRGIEQISKRIPAQVDHSGRFADSIGFWDNIKTAGDQTTAELHLLPRGVSPVVDLVWALRDHGAQLAASVGMRVKKWEPILDNVTKKATGGRRYLQTILHEISLVVSPANSEALEVMRSTLNLKPGSREYKALDKLVEKRFLFTQSDAAAAALTRSLNGHKAMKTIAEQIQEAEQALNDLRDEQTTITKALGEETDEDARATLEENGAAVAEKITKAIGRVDQLKAIETSLAPRAKPVPGAPAVVDKNNLGDKKADGMNVIRSALCIYESYLRRQPLDDILKSRYGGNEALEVITRAAQNPAMTSVPQWAGVLTRETWGAFMELLQNESVIPQMPMVRYSFDQYGKINIGKRNAVTTPNLASAFRGEGAPIRVGAVSLGLDSLTPKTAGVIGTFTMELFEQSTPNIETEIRKWIEEDTAQAIDSVFLSTSAGTTIQPAGIAYNLGANSVPSTGNTVQQITDDIRGMAQRMAAAKQGKKGSTVWVMDPARLVGLQLAITAAGTLAFPSTTQNMLLGYPIVTSNTVPDDMVYLVDCSSLAFASAPPQFMGTEVATLHEEDAVPLPITDGAGVAAKPVRSLYQTYSSALRGIYKLDWKVMRPGSVQVLTGVAW